jgi:hypothetical protein
VILRELCVPHLTANTPPIPEAAHLWENAPMTRRGYFLRLAFSVVIDLFDFTLGRIPVFGSATDGVGTVVMYAMWGPVGLVNLLEVIDVTEFADGFIPTSTLVALYVGWRQGFLTGKAMPPATRT